MKNNFDQIIEEDMIAKWIYWGNDEERILSRSQGVFKYHNTRDKLKKAIRKMSKILEKTEEEFKKAAYG